MESELLTVLDDTTVKILAAASTGPISATAIQDAFNIPKSTLYRRLETLVEIGALQEEPQLDDHNNRYFNYTATLTQISVNVDDGHAHIQAEFTNDRTYQVSHEISFEEAT